jgi:hypothetical protein
MVKYLFLLLVFIPIASLAQDWKPVELEFDDSNFSKPLLLPYPIRDASKDGGPTYRLYTITKNNKPYTIEDGKCTVVGLEGSPEGSFSYKVYLNKNGVWSGYINSDFYTRESDEPKGGVLVQCIDN